MIRKAVIPAAGFGTRFLPITKAQPKEMIPVVDTPVIQYVVEEAVASGVTDILMVIGQGKRAIEEHFDRSYRLENTLESKGMRKELERVRSITSMANIHFIWQKEMRGLGDAINYARFHVGDEPFAVLLGDTIMRGGDKPVISQLINVYNKYKSSIVALEEVDKSVISRYGVIDGDSMGNNIFKANSFIEKPSIKEAPSNLAIASRYIFTPAIFDYLCKTKAGKNGEIQVTDAMQSMLKDHDIYGLKFLGKRFDIGNKLDFLKTNILFGMEQKDIGEDLKEWVASFAKK